MSAPPGPLARLDALLGRPVEMRSLALLRILVGPIAIVHLWPTLDAAIAGDTFHGRFHHPYASWLPVAPPGLYTALLVVAVVAAGAMTVGLGTRVATATVAGVIAYELALSTTHFHNNRAYLLSIVTLLALAPTGRVWSVDAAIRRRRGLEALDTRSPAWPVWLIRFQCATVYAASGFSKLVDPDWFGGTVTWGRVVTQEHLLRASVIPDVVADVLVDRSFHTIAAKAIVLTELFIAAGLWWRRTRPWAVATAVAFHVMIELSASVQVFSYLGIAVLVVWADPGLPRLQSWIPKVSRWLPRPVTSPPPSG